MPGDSFLDFDDGSGAPTSTESLRRREAFLNSIISTAVDGVVAIDEAGIIRFFSPAAEQLFGYRADEVIGSSVNKLMPEPERGAHDGYLARYLATGEARIIGIGREVTGQRKDGSLFPIDLAVSEFHADGHRMFTGVVRDLSGRRQVLGALRESQERFRDLAESASDWFWETDSGDKLTFVSRRFEEFFGLSVESQIGQPRLAPLRDADSVARARHATDIAERRAFRDYRDTLIDLNGRVRHIRLSGIPRFDEDEAFLGYRGVGADITATVEAEVAARRAAAELQQAQKMEAIGQLTGGVAHDFNNLLTVILGNLEMLEGEIDEDARSVLIAEALEATELGAELTDRLLAFARRQPLEPRLIDLNQLVAGMGELLARALPESISIEYALSDLPCRAMVDPGQVENAILNLAINARDAMPAGGLITMATDHLHLSEDGVEPGADLPPGRYVVMTISDDGPGMKPEVRERAFEPFFTTKEAGAGTGLGLSTIFGFAKQSGGLASLESAAGVGTTVSIYLPAANAPDAVNKDERGTADETMGRGETVLVVEDNESVRRVTRRRLKALGYNVHEAGTGPDAVKQMENTAGVDLLFTDFVLPGGMTGGELAKTLRARYPALRIVVSSGYADPEKLDAKALGDDISLLRKPYSLEQLAAALKQALI